MLAVSLQILTLNRFASIENSKSWAMTTFDRSIWLPVAATYTGLLCRFWDTHCEPKNTLIFLSYLPQNPIDSDKIWYTLSRINLRYSSLNVFQLAWIMSLHYLVKLSVRVLYVGTANSKTHQMFLSHRLQNQANYDNFVFIVLNIFATDSYKCFLFHLNNVH